MGGLLGAVCQLLLMGDPARRLEREDETLRDLLGPVRERGAGRHSIEGVVDLHRGELLRVEFQHPRAGKIGGEETSFSSRVAVAAWADANGHDSVRQQLFPFFRSGFWREQGLLPWCPAQTFLRS